MEKKIYDKDFNKAERTDLFWYRIDLVLKKRGMTLKDLSEAADIKYQTIAGWRLHKRLPDLSSALDIAKVLDVSVEYLTEIGYLDNSISKKAREFLIDMDPGFEKNNKEASDELLSLADKLNKIFDGYRDASLLRKDEKFTLPYSKED